MKQLLDARYAELCKDLGNLEVNRREIERRIDAVLSEIRGLENFCKSLPKKEPASEQEPERK